jgi:hypothetical protein
MTTRIEEHRTKAGHRVLYYIVMDENDKIIILTKSGIIARSFLKN